jgi:hypothetical protein
MDYQILSINEKLRFTLKELEIYFGIELDQREVERVFDDAENDQVSYKTCVFYQKANFFFPTWEISATVEEYGPENLLLKSSSGFGKKRKFEEFFAKGQ